MASRLTLLLVAVGACAEPPSPVRMRADVRFLSSDLLEGRAPGTRGDKLAAEYIRSEFEHAGLRTSFQAVPLVGVETLPESTLGDFMWLDDFVGHTRQQAPYVAFESDVVFVGHGITAPEYGWNDYQGVDVRGKTVVLFTDEPPSNDATFFDGRALTRYGRWTYKFEEAARRGAAAALIIHTPETAGYGWGTVRGSWGREDPQLQNDAASGALEFEGWLTAQAAQRWLGTDVNALLGQANRHGFRARPLGKRLAGRIVSKIRQFDTRNVIAISPGSDPAVEREAVTFTAHLDHLGGNAEAEGDQIYNGAVDNATGCAVLLEIARLWNGLDPRPRRSAVFVATAAEEAGLLGARRYVADPAVALANTKLSLNFDSFFPYGRTKDFILDRAEKTPYWGLIRHVADRFGVTIIPDPTPEIGAYFRADHFPFAEAGVPAFSVWQGAEFVTDSERKAQWLDDFQAHRYHQPSDEYSEDWDFSGMEQVARIGYEIGLAVANSP